MVYVIPSAVGPTPGMGVAVFRGARAQTKQAMAFKAAQMDSMRRQQTLAEVQVMIQQRQSQQRQELNERQLDAQIKQNQASLGIRAQELDARLKTLQSSMDSRELRDEEFRDRIHARGEARTFRVELEQTRITERQLARFDTLRHRPQVRRAGPGEVAPVGFHIEEFVGVPTAFPLIVPNQFKDPVAERGMIPRRERSLRANVSTALSAMRVYGQRLDRHTASYNKMGKDLAELQKGKGAKFRVPAIREKQRQMADLKRRLIDPIQTQFDAVEDRWLEANESLRRYQQGAVEEPPEAEPLLIRGAPQAAPPAVAPVGPAPIPEEQRRREMGEVFEGIDAAFEEPSPRATDRAQHESWYAKVRPELLTMLAQALPLAQATNNTKALALIEQLNDDIARGLTHPNEVSLAMGLLRDFINQQGQP